MSLKVIKGGKKAGVQSDKGIFIIEARKIEDKSNNIKGEVGYIAEVNGKISVAFKLIPQVVRYSSYKEASRQINHIQSHIGRGVELNILGKKAIEEIIAGDADLNVVVPAGEVKEAYIVAVYDTTTKETIGYITFNPQGNNYYMKKTKEAVSFWEGKKTVDQFVDGAKRLIASHPNLELRPEKLTK